MSKGYSDIVETARSYYNSDDADNFYFNVWGGEDIHIGLYNADDEPIRAASRRTVERMADKLGGNANSRAIDLGGAYGGSARYVASKFGCKAVSLNLSEVQNERARQQNADAGMAEQVEVVTGSFEDVPFDNDSFDIVWSQDAFLHSGNREQVLAEIKRILKPGGEVIFTDPMQADNVTSGEDLQPVLDRINLTSMGSPGFYRQKLTDLGLEEIGYENHVDQLPLHYHRVKQDLNARYDELLESISRDYLDNMIVGLEHWVNNGKKGNLAWGIIHFRLPG